MSIALMTLAWKSGLPSGQKMVLLALCDNANDQGECYPSVPMLAKKCSMGERTVQQHITDLEAAGIVTREMRHGRSTVYHINVANIQTRPAETHYIYRIEDVESGEFYVGVRTCPGPAETDGYMGSGAWFNERTSHGFALRKFIVGKFATRAEAEQAESIAIQSAVGNPLCRNKRTPAVSAPREICTPRNLHPTPAESAPPPPQISHPTPADLAPITINEPPVEPSGKRQRGAKKPAAAVVVVAALPDWLPLDAWNGYLEMRREKRKAPTEHAVKLVLADLAKWHAAGHDIEAVLNASTKNGWTDVYEPKGAPPGRGAPLAGSTSQLTKAGQATARNMEAWIERKRKEQGNA